MKKWILFWTVVGVMFASASFVFAEEGQDQEQEQGGMMMGGPAGKGKDMHKMMGMMHKDSLVATSDGGVVVMQGPRLIKYDASLTLVKEVELPKGKKPGPDEIKMNQGAAQESDFANEEPAADQENDATFKKVVV